MTANRSYGEYHRPEKEWIDVGYSQGKPYVRPVANLEYGSRPSFSMMDRFTSAESAPVTEALAEVSVSVAVEVLTPERYRHSEYAAERMVRGMEDFAEYVDDPATHPIYWRYEVETFSGLRERLPARWKPGDRLYFEASKVHFIAMFDPSGA